MYVIDYPRMKVKYLLKSRDKRLKTHPVPRNFNCDFFVAKLSLYYDYRHKTISINSSYAIYTVLCTYGSLSFRHKRKDPFLKLAYCILLEPKRNKSLIIVPCDDCFSL